MRSVNTEILFHSIGLNTECTGPKKKKKGGGGGGGGEVGIFQGGVVSNVNF